MAGKSSKPPPAPPAAPKEKKKRVGPFTFLSQVRAEGNKVTWTTRQETIQATIFVLVMSVIIAAFLFLTDTVIQIFVNFVRGA